MPKKKHDLLNDYHLLCYDELDSTNEEAKRLAKGGGAHGAFLWSKEQEQGRGRYGRDWISTPGNLFASVLLSPACSREDAPQLSFVSALAAHEAIRPLLPEDKEATVKWPNDLLVDGKKLGGILLESFEFEGKFWVVVGLGVNIDSHPKDVMFPATSLRSEGVEIVSAKIVLSRFIHHFIECYNVWENKGFDAIRKSWMKSAWGVGEPLCARLPNEEIEGTFKEITDKGALVLKLDSKRKRVIHAADIFPSERIVEEAR